MAGDDDRVLRRKLATACRILAHAGLIEDVLGHVSVRVDDDTLLVRCRDRRSAGSLFTDARRRPLRARSTAADRRRRRLVAAERAADPPRLLPRRPGVRRRRPRPPAGGDRRRPRRRPAACRSSARTTSPPPGSPPTASPCIPRAVLISTRRAGGRDARGDGRPPGVRAARPRDHDDRRDDRAGRRPRPRRRLAGPHGDRGRSRRRHGRRHCPTTSWPSCPTSARRSTTSCCGAIHERAAAAAPALGRSTGRSG